MFFGFGLHVSVSISQHVNTPGQGNRNLWRRYLMKPGHTRLLLLSISIFFSLKKKFRNFLILFFFKETQKKQKNCATSKKFFSITPIFPKITTSSVPSPSSNASVVPIKFLHSYFHHYHIKCMENLFINFIQSYQLASKRDLVVKTLLCIHSFNIQHSVRSIECFGLE